MINTAKLKGRMAEHGFNQTALSKALGMSRTSFNLKLNNVRGRYFTVHDLEIMKKLLSIDDPADLSVIFFAP